MPEVVDSDRGEMLRRAQPCENLSLGDERSQVHDALISIVEFDLEYAMDDGSRLDNTRQLLHSIGSTFSCASAAANRSSSTSLRSAAQDSTLRRFAAGKDQQ